MYAVKLQYKLSSEEFSSQFWCPILLLIWVSSLDFFQQQKMQCLGEIQRDALKS